MPDVNDLPPGYTWINYPGAEARRYLTVYDGGIFDNNIISIYPNANERNRALGIRPPGGRYGRAILKWPEKISVPGDADYVLKPAYNLADGDGFETTDINKAPSLESKYYSKMGCDNSTRTHTAICGNERGNGFNSFGKQQHAIMKLYCNAIDEVINKFLTRTGEEDAQEEYNNEKTTRTRQLEMIQEFWNNGLKNAPEKQQLQLAVQRCIFFRKRKDKLCHCMYNGGRAESHKVELKKLKQLHNLISDKKEETTGKRELIQKGITDETNVKVSYSIFEGLNHEYIDKITAFLAFEFKNFLADENKSLEHLYETKGLIYLGIRERAELLFDILKKYLEEKLRYEYNTKRNKKEHSQQQPNSKRQRTTFKDPKTVMKTLVNMLNEDRDTRKKSGNDHCDNLWRKITTQNQGTYAPTKSNRISSYDKSNEAVELAKTEKEFRYLKSQVKNAETLIILPPERNYDYYPISHEKTFKGFLKRLLEFKFETKKCFSSRFDAFPLFNNVDKLDLYIKTFIYFMDGTKDLEILWQPRRGGKKVLDSNKIRIKRVFFKILIESMIKFVNEDVEDYFGGKKNNYEDNNNNYKDNNNNYKGNNNKKQAANNNKGNNNKKPAASNKKRKAKKQPGKNGGTKKKHKRRRTKKKRNRRRRTRKKRKRRRRKTRK